MASQSNRDVPFDIKKRTFLFAVRIVQLVGKLPRTVAGIEIGRQLLRAGTSVGSNVEEADELARILSKIANTASLGKRPTAKSQ